MHAEPSRGGGKPGEILLAARYLETADGDLARARVALRLRLEGDAWVQTLKAEGRVALQRLEPPKGRGKRHTLRIGGGAVGDGERHLMAHPGEVPGSPDAVDGRSLHLVGDHKTGSPDLSVGVI